MYMDYVLLALIHRWARIDLLNATKETVLFNGNRSGIDLL